MNEWDEIAQNMLAAYEAWLDEQAEPYCFRSFANARSFINLDPILREESAQMRDNIAAALHRLSGRIR